jgi:2-polyprenyl-6-methoxyphenol hydroxylase-like FAD-dependent oxidoreductase
MTFSVVVIGAGPAGLSAALALGARGISTLVCESSRLPVDKACGEGIMPSGVADLGRLGLPLAELYAQGHPFAGVRWFSEGGRVTQASFAEGPGLGLRRVALSELLLARISELPSVSIVQGVRAELHREQHSRFAVEVAGSLLEPQLIVGADGLNSRVRRQARISSQAVSPLRWGVRRHLAVEPWTDHVEVYWSSGAEAYVTPVAAKLVNVAFLFDRKRLEGRSGAELFTYLLSRFPALEKRLGSARWTSTTRASGPFHQWPARPYRRGLVLLGDAAGYVDALTGEGVSVALRQALLLAELVGPSLALARGEPISVHVLSKFVRRARWASRGARRLSKSLLWLERHPRLLEQVITRLGNDDRLFRHFLSANQGTAPLFGLPLRSASPGSRPWHALRHPA